MTIKKVPFTALTAQIDPAMLAAAHTFVAAYMARRAGVTVAAQEGLIDANTEVNSSYQRKMARFLILLTGQGGFSLTKQTNTAPAPPAPETHVAAEVEPGSLLAGIMGKPAPGTGAS